MGGPAHNKGLQTLAPGRDKLVFHLAATKKDIMKNILAILFIIFLLVGSSACTGSSYDCTYTYAVTLRSVDKSIIKEAKTIPVVCSKPVKIHDLINQSREKVESILGPGVNAYDGVKAYNAKGRTLIADSDAGEVWETQFTGRSGENDLTEAIAYRGGGIVVAYNDEDLSQVVRVSTKYLSQSYKIARDPKEYEAFFSTKNFPSIALKSVDGGGCLVMEVFKVCVDGSKHPLIISPVTFDESDTYTTYREFSAYIDPERTCP